MKIFAVYARVHLTQKPDWLDDFRSKYDEPYEYHVTLKQPCVIKDELVPELKIKLTNFFSNLKTPNNKIRLTFDSLNVPMVTPDDICIMINATKIDEIKELQKSVLLTLSEYNQYLDIKYKAYEENFQPHITIGRKLNQQAYSLASKELKDNYLCEGIITQVVLGVVQNDNPTEANNPNNQTVYNL